jgi:hypothetical protein
MANVPPAMWRIDEIEQAMKFPGTRIEIKHIDFKEPWKSEIYLIREDTHA